MISGPLTAYPARAGRSKPAMKQSQSSFDKISQMPAKPTQTKSNEHETIGRVWTIMLATLLVLLFFFISVQLLASNNKNYSIADFWSFCVEVATYSPLLALLLSLAVIIFGASTNKPHQRLAIFSIRPFAFSFSLGVIVLFFGLVMPSLNRIAGATMVWGFFVSLYVCLFAGICWIFDKRG